MNFCYYSYKILPYIRNISLNNITDSYRYMSFRSRWIKSGSIVESNMESCLPKYCIPLKPRINEVLRQIEVQISRLGDVINGLISKDEETFRKIMFSIKENDTQYHKTLSSDIFEIRKVSTIVNLSLILFKKLETQLKKVSDFGDLVNILGPSLTVVKNLRASLIPYLPQIGGELGSISELLGGLLIDAGQVGGYTINFSAANEEAVHLLKEASLVAELKTKEELSDLINYD